MIYAVNTGLIDANPASGVSMSCVSVIYGIARPSTHAEPDSFRTDGAADTERIRARTAKAPD